MFHLFIWTTVVLFVSYLACLVWIHLNASSQSMKKRKSVNDEYESVDKYSHHFKLSAAHLDVLDVRSEIHNGRIHRAASTLQYPIFQLNDRTKINNWTKQPADNGRDFKLVLDFGNNHKPVFIECTYGRPVGKRFFSKRLEGGIADSGQSALWSNLWEGDKEVLKLLKFSIAMSKKVWIMGRHSSSYRFLCGKYTCVKKEPREIKINVKKCMPPSTPLSYISRLFNSSKPWDVALLLEGRNIDTLPEIPFVATRIV